MESPASVSDQSSLIGSFIGNHAARYGNPSSCNGNVESAEA